MGIKRLDQMKVSEIRAYVKDNLEEGNIDIKKIDEFFKEYLELINAELQLSEDSFFGAFLLKMEKNFDYKMPNMAGVHIERGIPYLHLNPLFILLICDVKEFQAILKHEVYHLLNYHLSRAKKFHSPVDQDIQNIAMDCAINQYIPNLPEGCVTIESVSEKYELPYLSRQEKFEYYMDMILNSNKYEQMKQEEYERQQKLNDLRDLLNDILSSNDGNGNSSGSNSDEEQDNQGNDGEGDDGEEKKNKQDDGDGDGNNNDGNGKNKRRGLTKEDLEKIIRGEIPIDHSKWDETAKDDIDGLKDLVKNMANDALKRAGKAPDIVQQLIGELNEPPKIPWEKEFAKMVGSVKVPFKKTILRRDRRQMDRFDIKGRISDRKVKCAVAIDTSGSMGEEELKYVFTEIFSILDSLRFELTIIECDCEIQRVYTAKCLNDVDTKVKGRGGTSFQPIFKYIHENKKLRQQLDFLIVFTDGYGEYEMSEEYKPRGFDLMWVLTESVKTLSVKNPWTNKLRELDFRNRNKR